MLCHLPGKIHTVGSSNHGYRFSEENCSLLESVSQEKLDDYCPFGKEKNPALTSTFKEKVLSPSSKGLGPRRQQQAPQEENTAARLLTLLSLCIRDLFGTRGKHELNVNSVYTTGHCYENHYSLRFPKN